MDDYLRCPNYYNEGPGYQIISNASPGPYPPLMPHPPMPGYRHPFQPWEPAPVPVKEPSPDRAPNLTEQVQVYVIMYSYYILVKP